MTSRSPSPSRFLLLQLADGTFPSGGFAHSAGLEAASVLGALDTPRPASSGASASSASPPGDAVALFLDGSLRQLGRAALPFVLAAARDPACLPRLDDAYDATLPLLAPNHASRAQGRALVGAASRVWAETASIATHARSGPAHHAPVFGAIFGTLGMSADDTLAAYLHGAARGVLSAGVRLGLLGPLEAQRLLSERAALLETILDDARDLDPSAAAQTAPLLEIYAALHDRLDGRMFQS